ncbi:MAG: helix-turn-helix domain-containing protein [Opitutaceae bacterium]|nr:helix-turn-helix domain-containing protein [Opitutaceae bacterium]
MRAVDPKLHARRRSAILKAAQGCFAKRGFSGTGMKQVCRSARMSPGVVYHYFKNKEAIVAAFIEEDMIWARDRLLALRTSEDPLAHLFLMLDEVVERMDARSLALHSEINAELARNARVRRVVLASDEECRQSLIAALDAAKARGDMKPSMEAENAAFAIMALYDGWLCQASLKGPKALRERQPAMRDALRALLVPDAR